MSEQLSFIRNSGTDVVVVTSSDLRLCVFCDRYKPLDEFYTNRHRHKSRCKSCERIRERKWSKSKRVHIKQKDPNRLKVQKRRDQLRHRFNLTIGEYDKILEKQQGKCAICGGGKEKQKYKFAVDHCHATGKIRGILCRNCNVGLGFFKDNPRSLTNALTYLISSGI